MSVHFLGWRFEAPDGRVGQRFRRREDAVDEALNHALAAPRRLTVPASLDADTKARLWRSLEAKGWRVAETT